MPNSPTHECIIVYSASQSPAVIVESQIFAKINNAVVNIFVHKAFVSLFLQDWFLKEELMSKCVKTSRGCDTDWQGSFKKD